MIVGNILSAFPSQLLLAHTETHRHPPPCLLHPLVSVQLDGLVHFPLFYAPFANLCVSGLSAGW